MAEILRFPNSAENVADTVYLRITNFKPEFGGLTDFFALTGGTTEFTICLPLPVGFAVNGSITYRTEEAGMLGSLADFAGGDMQFDSEDIFGDAMAVFRSATGGDQNIGEGLTAIRRRARGEIANKREFKLFEGVPMRSFSFTFSLVPSNQKESDDVHRIIYLMRRAASPALTDKRLQFKHPDFFDIAIRDPRGQSAGIIKMPRCVCESVTAAYNTGEFAYFRTDGMPTKVDFTLSFKELEAIDKQRIMEDF